MGEGTVFLWENDLIRSPNPILAQVRRWRVVQEEREEREMDELEDTRETMEAMDKVVRSEFHEVESSVQDT